jgi:hypothetical protein
MKKIFLASATLLWVLSFSACETKKSETTEEETVVERDSVPSEYEVTEKTVETETDTTVTTKKVDVDDEKEDKD